MKIIETARERIAQAWRNLTAEKGMRVASDTAMERQVRNLMFVDTERRAMVALMREMDRKDGRVKRIHNQVSRDTIRGGLVLEVKEKSSSETLKKEWEGFKDRLQLNKAEKLRSDCRGMVMEGNLAHQLVLDDAQSVAAAVRMPSDTIVPLVSPNGRFADPGRAFEQRDVMTGQVLASFAAWQLQLSRLDPDSFDDLGSMGRPMLDSVATTWRKLVMTEEDLVLRRRMRAPLRFSHVLEGATPDEVAVYRKDNEGSKGEISTDFYSNKRGGVTALQGDETLGDIGDVVHLMDTFFAGSPAPKALFGYTNGLSRDILEDLKRSYYDEVDGMQDLQASAYIIAFRIHLLFKGIDPGPDEFLVRFAERRTETANQAADLALKYQALAIPQREIDLYLGFDPDVMDVARKEQAKRTNPYPAPGGIGGRTVAPPRVSVTPGNAPKGESATSISNPGGNGGKGRG